MKRYVKIVYIILSIIFLFYLLLPNPTFPEQLPNSLQSEEPADTETDLRRAYFTNSTRSEVMDHYKKQLQHSAFMNLPLPTYRLNYPPEEAQVLIRDQTRSTFLEEVVHPFRESFFINGFKPKEEKDAIFIGGKAWRQKIIVRFVPSNRIFRITIAVSVLLLTWFIFFEWLDALKDIVHRKKS